MPDVKLRSPPLGANVARVLRDAVIVSLPGCLINRLGITVAGAVEKVAGKAPPKREVARIVDRVATEPVHIDRAPARIGNRKIGTRRSRAEGLVDVVHLVPMRSLGADVAHLNGRSAPDV